MANEIVPKFRYQQAARSVDEGDDGKPDNDAVDRRAVADDPRTVDTKKTVEAGDDPDIVETDEEREERERGEYLERVEATEIFDDAESSAAYRRAMAEYDPKRTDIQEIEGFEYRDADLDTYGRF